MIDVAMLSKWHVHAGDYVREIQAHPDVRICAVWDEDMERGKAWAAELGIPFYEDIEDILSNPSITGVVVDSPTTTHYEVIHASIAAGKHVFTEKVVEADYDRCKELLTFAEDEGVKVIAALPRLTQTAYVLAQQAMSEGLLGDITQIRCRMAHDGAVSRPGLPNGWLPADFLNPEKSAGGALIDLGAHPIYLSNRFGGSVRSVSARLPGIDGPNRESLAALVVEYESGVIGTLETSFLSGGGSLFELQLYGTRGTFIAHDDDVVIRHSVEKLYQFQTLTPTLNSAPGLTPFQQWIEWILHDREPVITKQDMLDLTLVNVLALRSEESGRRVYREEI